MPSLSIQEEGVQTNKMQTVALERLFYSPRYWIRFWIAKITFHFFWLPGQILFRFFVHYSVENGERAKRLKGPLIIASNHLSFPDPFLISAIFPFANSVFPIRFGVKTSFYYQWYLWPFAWLFGTFPLFKQVGMEQSLRVPLEILRNNGVVGFFPEGAIHAHGRLRNPRKGVAYLALQSGVPVLPVRVKGALHLGFWRFFSRRACVTIAVGEPMTFPNKTITENTLERVAQNIMETVDAL